MDDIPLPEGASADDQMTENIPLPEGAQPQKIKMQIKSRTPRLTGHNSLKKTIQPLPKVELKKQALLADIFGSDDESAVAVVEADESDGADGDRQEEEGGKEDDSGQDAQAVDETVSVVITNFTFLYGLCFVKAF